MKSTFSNNSTDSYSFVSSIFFKTSSSILTILSFCVSHSHRLFLRFGQALQILSRFHGTVTQIVQDHVRGLGTDAGLLHVVSYQGVVLTVLLNILLLLFQRLQSASPFSTVQKSRAQRVSHCISTLRAHSTM